MPVTEYMHDEGPSVVQSNGYMNGSPHSNSHAIQVSKNSDSSPTFLPKMTGQKMFSEAGPRDHALRVAKGLSLEEQVTYLPFLVPFP